MAEPADLQSLRVEVALELTLVQRVAGARRCCRHVAAIAKPWIIPVYRASCAQRRPSSLAAARLSPAARNCDIE